MSLSSTAFRRSANYLLKIYILVVAALAGMGVLQTAWGGNCQVIGIDGADQIDLDNTGGSLIIRAYPEQSNVVVKLFVGANSFNGNVPNYSNYCTDVDFSLRTVEQVEPRLAIWLLLLNRITKTILVDSRLTPMVLLSWVVTLVGNRC